MSFLRIRALQVGRSTHWKGWGRGGLQEQALQRLSCPCPMYLSISGAGIQPPVSRGPPQLEPRGAVVAPPPVRASQVVLIVKNPPAKAGDARDAGSIPGSGSSPGGGRGSPLQYSCLEDPMDRGAWQAGYGP